MGIDITMKINGGIPIKMRNFNSVGKIPNFFESAIFEELNRVINDTKSEGFQIAEDAKPKVTKENRLDTISLVDAYKTAMKKSKVIKKGNIINASFFDMGLMDEMTPQSKGSTSTRKGGWWRIHEFGSPGQKQGYSENYGFLNVNYVKNRLDMRYKENKSFVERISGRHGQGIMVKLASPLAKQYGVKPHPGIMPLRILQRTLNRTEGRIMGLRDRLRRNLIRKL